MDKPMEDDDDTLTGNLFDGKRTLTGEEGPKEKKPKKDNTAWMDKPMEDDDDTLTGNLFDGKRTLTGLEGTQDNAETDLAKRGIACDENSLSKLAGKKDVSRLLICVYQK